MMSKERELLKECRLMLDNPFNGTAGLNLQIRITELIAQPEPIEDKFDRVKSNRAFYQEGYAQAELDLKREPLSEQAIWNANTEQLFEEGVRWAEQQHRIIGEDDE